MTVIDMKHPAASKVRIYKNSSLVGYVESINLVSGEFKTAKGVKGFADSVVFVCGDRGDSDAKEEK